MPDRASVAGTARSRWASELASVPTVYDDQEPDLAVLQAAPTWARVRVEFLSGRHAGYGDGDLYVGRGRVLASVFVPPGTGDAAALAVVDAAVVAFRLHEEADLRFEVPIHRPGRREGQWWVVDVDVPFEFEETD